MPIVGTCFPEKYIEEVRFGVLHSVSVFLCVITCGGQVSIHQTAQRHILKDGKLDTEVDRDDIQSCITNVTNSMYSSKYKLQLHSLLL
jgi:hypothetical protein